MLVGGDPSQKVAVVRIIGGLSAQSVEQFTNLLKRVEADSHVKAMVLEIDSPGGGVTPSDEIYNAVKQFKARKGIPIVTAMGQLCASGGYYVACASDEIIAQPIFLGKQLGREGIAKILGLEHRPQLHKRVHAVRIGNAARPSDRLFNRLHLPHPKASHEFFGL